MQSTTNYQSSDGKYFLLSQYFVNAANTEDLKLSNCVISSYCNLVKQEKLLFAETVVGGIAELINEKIPVNLLEDQLFYTDHKVRAVETGEFVRMIALVLGPFNDVKNDDLWRCVVEEGPNLLPSDIVHFKVVH
mmetsp:Transcript_25401/g.38521  ORF Transcript_25401/g.38521 Transcript_25401/m.38521 type:complete len:134 (-) Transcript_25401:41-442(-)